MAFPWLIGVALVAVCVPARAADVPTQFTNWQTQEGLRSNKVMAVLQTQDGYIWIGTFEGLVRFDGVKFTLFDGGQVEALRDSTITCLYEGPDGTLWIGHATGAVTSLKQGVFTPYPMRVGWRASRIQQIGADEKGEIWIWDDAGELARLRDGKVLAPAEGLAAGIRLMSRDRDGRFWISSRGVLSVFERGELRKIPLLTEMDDYVQGVCASRDGGVWIVSQGGIWKWRKGEWSSKYGTYSMGATPLLAFIELADGKLVAGTSDHGAVVVTPIPFEERQLSRATGFASDYVLSLAEDHEGGLWIATGGAGLFRSLNEVVKVLAPPDAWQGRAVLTVTPAAAGGYWVGTEGAGLYRFDGDGWENYARDAGLRNPYVWSVLEDKRGTVWAGTWGGGLYEMNADQFTSVPSAAVTRIAAIASAQASGLWVGEHSGLLRHDGRVMQNVESGLPRELREVRAVLEQPDGTVWAACNGGGLARLRDGHIRRFTQRDGLPSDFVQSLYADAAGTIWIGTRGGGLGRYKDGKFATVAVAQGLSNNVVCHITEDALGFMWMSSHGGIMRVNKAELERCADGQTATLNCLTYGLSDGMETLACSGGRQPAGCTGPDGKLVFATDRGLAVIDPTNLRTNPIPPPVRVEQVRGGDRTLAQGSLSGRTVTIEPGTSRIEIAYTGLSFAAPNKVRFKRRLEGLDTGWVDVGTERLAVYNYVPPGKYQFGVIACNNDNVWSVEPATFSLVVLPFFWQTLWFKLLVVTVLVLTTAAAVWLQARARFRRVLERAERERAVEMERSRIANDMHDDLGSHLTRITMLSETARSEASDPARVQAGLGQIYETARNVTRAMDEIVWAVNPKHDTLESLIYYLEKFALELLGTAGMRARLDMPAELPDWNPRSEVRHNLFLAFKEALNNAVRHSNADTVTIALEIDATCCRLTVADNGRGLETPALGGERARDRIAGGHGVANMHERMERIGGRCEMTSGAGTGTIVVLSAPRLSSPVRKPPGSRVSCHNDL